MTGAAPIVVENAEDWSRLLAGFAHPSVLQTFPWGELKSRWGWKAHRLAWPAGPQGTAAAQVLSRPLPGGARFGYVPHGPIVPAARDDMWGRVLADLAAWASRRRVAVLKAEFDVAEPAPGLHAALTAGGWQPSHEAIQFPNTMVSDLSPDLDAILAAMKPKTRYNIRLAERRGIAVRRAAASAFDDLFELYAETAERDDFAIREKAYYLDAWGTLLGQLKGTVVLAERAGHILAANLIVAVGSTAYYMYGASATEGRRDMPAYLAQWDGMQWAREIGCLRYDWWGGPTTLDEDDPLWGVYRFKTGFGAEMLERPGPWDLAVNRPAYFAYRALTGLRRRLLHRL
jgi:lipid II:glycine glycyltransferase (peptidoglycan interpeptide bridge formation enzyme)